ncbi:hypothetical protein ACNKHX_21415 [Shigella flexneri]
MARYSSLLRALLVVLRNCHPLLYQYVDGGAFLPHMANPPNRCVSFVLSSQRYRDHHDDEFIRRCERVRRQFILTQRIVWSGGGQPDCIDDWH